MPIRSLLIAAACTLSLASFTAATPHAAAEEAATQLQCPPFCPNQGKAHDHFRERHKSQERFNERHKSRDGFRKRHHDGQPDFDNSYRKSHRYYKRPHSRKNVRLRFYPRYYEPFYYNPYYYDYYDEPYYGWVDAPDYIDRLTCKQAIAELRDRGYRNVKAYDCRGKSYGFYATRGGKKYKISVSSFDGGIISRKRITR